MGNYVRLIQCISSIVAECLSEDTTACILLVQLHGIENINKNVSYHDGHECRNLLANKLFDLLHKQDFVLELNQYRFGIVLKDVPNQTRLLYIINQLLSVVNKYLEINGRKFKIDLTIGASTFPNDSSSAEELLRLAEISLDQAIAKGLNYKISSKAERNAAIQSSQIEQLIHSALDEMELEVLYQPKIHLNDQKMHSMEALLRWNSKTLGEISPSIFIPIVEKTPLMMEITEFLIKRVCNDRSTWPSPLRDMKIAVNIPIDVLRTNDVIEMLNKIGAIWDVEFSSLVFEITERSMVPNFSDCHSVIDSLKELGIGISVDDFGIEYSSLSCLKDLAPDEIKIDRAFISKVSDCSKTYNLVSAVIKIAEVFGCTTVAEGIEDAHTLDIMNNLGCDIGQGYYISKAISANHITEWFEHYHQQLKKSAYSATKIVSEKTLNA